MRRDCVTPPAPRQRPTRIARSDRDSWPHHPWSADFVSSVVSEMRRTWTRARRRQSIVARYRAAIAALILLLVTAGVGLAGPGHLDPFVSRAAPADALACRVFPADNAWNQRIDALPVHPNSA